MSGKRGNGKATAKRVAKMAALCGKKTISEMAIMLGLSYHGVLWLCKKYKIPFKKIGKGSRGRKKKAKLETPHPASYLGRAEIYYDERGNKITRLPAAFARGYKPMKNIKQKE